MFDLNTIFIITILFFSSLIRSTFGFGNSLVAMPLIVMILDIKTSAPLVALVAFTTSLTIAIEKWRTMDIKSVWRLTIASFIGIPAGILYLKHANEDIIKLVLAVLIISFSLYSLIKPELLKLSDERFAYLFGFIAGLLGGTYNTDGPPIIIYAALKRWKPEELRATLQGYFLPTALFIALGHGLSGLWTPPVIKYFLISLPLIFIAIIMGSKINKLIPAEKFRKYIYIFLIIIAILLINNIFH